MGVHGLWDLLAPVGRRVSVETLAGKRLAIDASIWMVQFMKAMRDDKGEMVRNAHLLGFFRRICKLLFLRTKPVFVFDGGTPTLKRRTVIARRRQRENAQAKIRKTAEKLFLNQMKAMRLSNLADNLKDQKGSSKGKEVMVEQSETFEKDNAALGVKNQGMLDEMLAASIVAEECGGFGFTASTPSVPCANASECASAAANFTAKDEDSDDDEEMMMPITDGDVDPAVLAALPPSMQLDLLVQMRERLMAENRQKYQKVKKAPQKFSELQIEAYLKTVAFRREIDEVQRAASGRAVGGVQTSRIASEANREFIFSSSFTGDKQALVSSGAENHSEKQQPPDKNESSSNIIDAIVASGSKAVAEAGPTAPEVETYVDERGRKRIHRTRAMGIRMTRDLQRNIDLMKEFEHASTPVDNEKIEQTERESAVRPSGISGSDGKFIDCPEKALLQDEAQKESLKSESSIKISFDNDDKPISMDDDDAFFTRLVAGSPPSIHSDNSSASVEWEDGISANPSTSLHEDNNQETSYSHAENPNNNESDLEWEEGSFHVGNHIELQETNTKNLEELEQPSVDVPKAVSKGSAEEEFALQEAIRRSLTDITGEMTVIESLDSRNSKHGLQLGSEGRQPISKIGEALTGIYRPQFFIIENDQSSVLAVKDAYAPGSISDKELDSAVNDARTVLRTSEGDKKLPMTCSENAEIGNLGNSGSFAPAVMGFNSLSSSLPVPLTNDITNEEVITGTSDFLTGHGALGTGLQKSCGDILGKVVEDDIGFVSVLERGHDVHITAPFDEGVSNELLGASLEDELLVLDKEFKDLENEQKKLERNADSVNSEMFVECQELLQMFGLPYIIAPMEAEAQCAFLELANLVDGVVTDDSDVFLFGAQSVFKNIFDDRKYVETYLLKDIESELGLNTEKLIRMALLLGSDYTEGVSGVGIVNAIEVVNAFPEEDGLQKFREWVESPDPTILGLSVKKNGSKVTSATDCSTSEANEDTEATDSRKRKEIFMNKHRNVSKNWQFPVSFPSEAVIAAYKSPQVDKSAEPFGWGKPDIFSLRRLCSEKFAWANQKADELLLPVLKEYNKHETQLRLEAFYSFNERFANIRSKRIRQAVKGITGKRSLPDASDLQELPKQVTKRGENTSNKSNKERKDGTGEMHNSSKKKSSKSKSKKSDAKHKENTRQIIEEEDTRMGGTGCSRARGSSGKSIRKGRRMESSDSELDNTIFSSDEREQALQSGNEPLHCSVRRSKRSRKVTSYEEKDDESDELIKSPTRSSLECRNNETRKQNSFECEDVHKVDLTGCGSQQEVTSDGDGYGDYLARGGGFCADEDNAESLSNGTVSFQSKGAAIDDNGDYLQMGGGFCTDDPPDVNLANLVTDVDVNTSERHKSTYVDPSEEHKSTDYDITDSVNQSEEHKPIEVDRSRVAKNVRDYDVTASASAFSAIPFLKRKKRKK